ncbi:MAG: cation diffusion facilitator family transporter [Dehalococcoidia bacterium]
MTSGSDREPQPAHDHDHGRFRWLLDVIPFLHRHEDPIFGAGPETSKRGIWATKIGLIGLTATALFQLVIVALTGSVALLADTIHNFSDALTSVPLWIAFVATARPATRRYTFGYARAEDLVGALIVVMILVSAVVIGYESIDRLANPRPLSNLWLVIVAALIGFAGNEAVAVFRIRIGRQIGSVALVADGMHSRADGLTSLAVLVGALGVAAGFELADPIVGLLIGVAIVFIAKDSAVEIWRHLMDAIDPAIPETLSRAAAAVDGVEALDSVRARWTGHRLLAELNVVVDESLTTRESHRVAQEVRHALFHAQPQLADVTVHIDPCGHGGGETHVETIQHERP